MNVEVSVALTEDMAQLSWPPGVVTTSGGFSELGFVWSCGAVIMAVMVPGDHITPSVKLTVAEPVAVG